MGLDSKILHLYTKLDSDLEVLEKTLYVSLPGLFAAAWWIFVHTPCQMSFVLGACFISLVSYDKTKWTEKLKVMFFTAGSIAVFQFFDAILFHQKYLVLLMIFSFSFIIYAIPYDRAASAAAAALGTLSVTNPPGFHQGADRFINAFLGLFFAICASVLLSSLLGKQRISQTLGAYAEAMSEELSAIMAGKSPDSKRTMHFANHANFVVNRFRYAISTQNRYARMSQKVLFRMHTISRGILFLHSVPQTELEEKKHVMNHIIISLDKLGNALRKGKRFNLDLPHMEKFDNNNLDIGLKIISTKLMLLNDKELGE